MKAAVLTHYDKKGTDLKIQDIPLPVPEDDEILVRIMAAAVNPLETSVDTVFSLDQVNEALDKVRRGGSKGKTIIKVHESRSTNG